MRTLMFSNTYKPTTGGVITSLELFRKGLIQAGHEVHLVAPEYDGFADDEAYVFRAPAIDLPGDLGVSVAMPLKQPLNVTVHGLRPHIIHSHHPIWLGRVAASFANDLAIPLVFTFHTRYDAYAQQYVSIVPELAERTMHELVERYLAMCTHVVAPTESIRSFIRQEYDVQVPVAVVPTPIDLDEYANLEPDRVRRELDLEDAEVLLYVGRLGGEKGIDRVLRAFAHVAGPRPRARLLLIGHGAEADDLKRLSRKLGIGDRVSFLGWVPHEQVPDYYASADIFVFGSETETQGLVMMEAMAAGTPVLAVEAPGSVDVLAEGGGLLLPPSDEAFTTAILELLSDDQRRQNLGEEARRAVGRYSISEATEHLVAVYEEAIAAGPR
jgi:glycosyltransferase involved in cell wall biosynthesis